MTETIEEFKKQHLVTYQNAIIDLIKNNTEALIEGDIISLVKSPPLDSMDTIKSKLISLAKKEQIVLNNEKMSKILDQFRKLILYDFMQLKEIRNQFLVEKVKQFSPVRETEVIKIMKKDLDFINKEIKKNVKSSLTNHINQYLLVKIGTVYGENSSIQKLFSKYMKTTYLKQLNENIAIKILVKDRTLLNGIAEQGERYLFTKNNSHIFDEEKECN